GFLADGFASSCFSLASFWRSSASCFSISSICCCRASGGAARALPPSRSRPAQASGVRNQGRDMGRLRAGARTRGKEGEEHDLVAGGPPAAVVRIVERTESDSTSCDWDGPSEAQGAPPTSYTAADPLDGKVFRSVETLTGGDRRDGTIA